MAQAVPEKNQAKQTDETITIDELILRLNTFENLISVDKTRFERYKKDLELLNRALADIDLLTLEQVGSVFLEYQLEPQAALERFKSFVGQGLVLASAHQREKDTTTLVGFINSIAKSRSDSSYYSRNLLRCVFFKDSPDPKYTADVNVTLADISEHVMLLSLAKVCMLRAIDVKCFENSRLMESELPKQALDILYHTSRFTNVLSVRDEPEGVSKVPEIIKTKMNELIRRYYVLENPSKMGNPIAEDIKALQKEPLFCLIAHIATHLYKHTKQADLTPETESSIVLGLYTLMNNILKIKGEKPKGLLGGSDLRLVLKKEIAKQNGALTSASFACIMAGALTCLLQSKEEKASDATFKVTGNQLLHAITLLYPKASPVLTKDAQNTRDDVTDSDDDEDAALAATIAGFSK